KSRKWSLVRMNQLTLLLILPSLAVPVGGSDVEYCVIGGGPGGLQTAYYLQQDNRDYVVFEAEDSVGAFYKKYPIHEQLISINKVHTGSDDFEFNLRHDWNSLLQDHHPHEKQLLFKNVTEQFWPQRHHMRQYLEQFRQLYQLKVKLNSRVQSLTYNREKKEFLVQVANTNLKQEYKVTCMYVISAIGLGIPLSLFALNTTRHVNYADLDPADVDKFKGKDVVIFGAGNSAFETAAQLSMYANKVQMASRNRIKLAFQTHYVGDVRAINLPFLDTYQLKSLDYQAMADIRNYNWTWNDQESRFILDIDDSMSAHYFISCLGWQWAKQQSNNSEIMTASVTLEYGEGFSGPGKDTIREDRTFSGHNFLHPVIRIRTLNNTSPLVELHLREDITTLFQKDLKKLHQFFSSFFNSLPNMIIPRTWTNKTVKIDKVTGDKTVVIFTRTRKDLKLENILLDWEGHVKMADFGLCKEEMSFDSTTNTFCGTPEYLAPEILRDEDYGLAVDWWSLGVVSYEMLCGMLPFGGPNNQSGELFHQILEQKVRMPMNLSEEAKSFLSSLLVKNPAHRLGAGPQDAIAVMNHPFLSCTDWHKLVRKEITPPWKPQVVNEFDTKYIPEEFKNQPVSLTPPCSRKTSTSHTEGAYMKNFSFHGSRQSLASLASALSQG
ncbi:RAC-gamma serine/threonine-protein kinase, partial [Cichlidogyrus casuarinus]